MGACACPGGAAHSLWLDLVLSACLAGSLWKTVCVRVRHRRLGAERWVPLTPSNRGSQSVAAALCFTADRTHHSPGAVAQFSAVLVWYKHARSPDAMLEVRQLKAGGVLAAILLVAAGQVCNQSIDDVIAKRDRSFVGSCSKPNPAADLNCR